MSEPPALLKCCNTVHLLMHSLRSLKEGKISDQLTLRSTVLPPQAFNRLYLYNSNSICLGSDSDRLCAPPLESVVRTSLSTKAGRNDRHHVLQSLELAIHSGAEVGFVSRIGQGYIIACHCHMLLPLSVPMHSFDCQAATRLLLAQTP